ncbi:MAG: ScyD/ScyE family protein [Actinobacteria bacterium]|nr:MAG: ScyD/ScyE family protein [Actinomycetota bacterium]
MWMHTEGGDNRRDSAFRRSRFDRQAVTAVGPCWNDREGSFAMNARRTRLQPLLLMVAGTLSVALLLPPATASGDVRAPFGPICVGQTGAVTHVQNGILDRIVNLPSIASPDGSFAFGPHDVAIGDEGALFATVGLGGDPAYRAGFGPAGDNLATLVRITRSGQMRVVADLLAYEEAHNPAGGVLESDPYGILRRADSSIVADAGANDLLKVTDRGRVSTLAVFPDRMVDFQGGEIPMDAVPTTVVRGPDGAYYVGQLTGFPFPVHGARVFRVVPGQKPTVWARGFTNIIDIAFHDGKLYVLEIAHNSLATSSTPFGALLRLNPDGSKTVLFKDLFFPTSLAFTPGGDALVTNCGVCPGGGEVLRIGL